MKLLVLSDFHLGKGRFFKNGQLNILEDFEEDSRFLEFLDHYSSGKNYWADIHLVLNGDILNLIQIDEEGIFSHIVDDITTVNAINSVHLGHLGFFNGLRAFLSRPNKKITYIIGNHDAGMAFESAQKRFQELVGDSVDFAFQMVTNGVHIEHGHRFEVINHIPLNDYFVDGPLGKKILNLPWGSLFCLNLLPKLKKSRPHIDKIRPMGLYFKWCLINDPIFFIKMVRMLLSYFFQTRSMSYNRHLRNFKTTIKILKQITIFPRYGNKARSILKKNQDLSIVIMGHTHLLEWRKFSNNRYYLNTGTWNSIPSIDAAMHKSMTKLTYVSVDLNLRHGTVQEATLDTWEGKWRPYRNEVKINFSV